MKSVFMNNQLCCISLLTHLMRQLPAIMKVPRVYQLCKMYYRNNHENNCICLLQTELCYHAYFVMLLRVYKKKNLLSCTLL